MQSIYSLKGCVKDTLPAAMTATCKIQNSCAKLGTNKCSWKFKGALNAKCKRNLKSWHKWQNARVKTYCKQSCRNCARKFSVRTISFDKIACVMIVLWLFWTFIISYSELSTTGQRVNIEQRLDGIQKSQNAGKYLSPRGKFNI